MEQFLLELVHRGLAASLLAVVVILLRQFFKKMPKWVRLVLWGFVAFRLLCPISLETSFSLMPDVAKVSRTVEENLEPEVQILPKADVSENPVSDNFVVQDKIEEGKTDIVWTEPEPDRSVQEEDTILLPSDSNVADVGKENLPVVDAEKETPSVMDAGDEKTERTLSFWPAMWLSGVLLMALYGVVSYLKVKYQVRVSVLYKENIRYCDDIDVPFVFGLIKPHIYLPSGMEEDTAEHVLLHERQHLRRGDQWWKLLGFSLLSLFWFHPMLWVAYVLFCRDIEFSCDEKVVKALGEEERREYAQALLSCSIGRRVVLLCPTAFGENGVKGRIRSIMTYKKATIPLVIAAVAVCLLVGVLFLTDRENPYKIETSDITMEGVALKQSVAKHMAEDVARLMGEAGGKRYKLDNFKFNFYELETESKQQLFRISVEADKTMLQSPEDSSLIAGMKKAQAEFSYDAEKEFAQRMIDSMVAQMESEKEQHICEPAIFATLKEDGGYELTYGNAERTPLKKYFDKENRKQEEVLGYLTVYQRAGKNPPMDAVGSYGSIYSKALNNPETKKYNERAYYVFSPTLYYKEGVYSYLERYDAEDKSELPWELLGEELTEVYSNHEMYWSERDALLECTGGGTLYRIKGYEDTYRVAMVYEQNRRNDDYLELQFLTTGSRPEIIFQSAIGQANEEEIRSDATTYHMIILERMNDLWFHEGREVFQQRMHLENAASVNGLSTEEELFWSLLAELYEATFIHPSSGSFPEFQGEDYRLLRVKDALGFEHSLVLYEGGYVKMTVNETELVVQIDEALCRLVMERIASYNIEQFEVSLEGAISVEAILNQEEAYREVYETILDRIEMLTTTKDWQFFGEEGCYVSRVPIRYYEVPEDEVSGTTTLILFSKDFSKAASISLFRYADGFYSVNVNDTWNIAIQKVMQENPKEEVLFIDVLMQEDLTSSIMSRKSLILDEQNEARYVYPPGAYYLENDLYQKLYSDELAVSYEELTAKENLIWISAEKAAAATPTPTPMDTSQRGYQQYYESFSYAAYPAEEWMKTGRLIVPFTKEDSAAKEHIGECFAMYYIPEEAMSAASTADILRVACEWPYTKYDLYNYPSYYLRFIIDKFNGMDELFRRQDFAVALLKEYEAVGFYVTSGRTPGTSLEEYKKQADVKENAIVFMEILLATNEVYDQLTHNERVMVLDAVSEKMTMRKSGICLADERVSGFYAYVKENSLLGNKWYDFIMSGNNKTNISYLDNAAYPMDHVPVTPLTAAEADAMQPMVFGADEVLKTGGLQAGEKIYFLQVIGKRRLDGENMCGIREIRVYDEDELVQTVQMQEGIMTDGADGIAPGYTQCFTPAESVTLKDINFDGYPDLEVFGWIVNGNTPYYYWCWNPETEQFEYAFCYQITGMDEERKLLVASHYAGGVHDMAYFTDYYRVTKNNKLELIESETKVEPFNGYQGWKKAYLDLIYYAPNNLANPYVYPDYVRTDTRWYAKEKYLYLGLHDFDSDGTPELILGDAASLAVFTYKNGSVEKMVDITMECCWRGVCGVAIRDNTILISDHGSDGSGYVAWSYRDGAWVKAVYCEYHPKQCTINKEPATYEEFCETTSFDPKDWEGSIRPYGIDLVKIVREEETLFWEQESKTVLREDVLDVLYVE